MFNDEISELIAKNEIADLVIDVCSTLYDNGVEFVHVGGLMRLLGIDDAEAAQHDETYFHLDEQFAQKVSDLNSLDEDYETEITNTNNPPTIH